MNKNWFEMAQIRRRRLDQSVWVPLRDCRSRERGAYGTHGYNEEFFGAGTLLVPISSVEAAQALTWMQIGLMREHGPIVDNQHYTPTGLYRIDNTNQFGEDPVLEQRLPGGDPTVWHLHHDIVFALGLLREGDVWLRPDEMYVPVARLARDTDGKPRSLEIKSEFLKDYLRARGMALRVSRYISRTGIFQDVEQLGWPEGSHSEDAEDQRYERTVTKIHEGGDIFGSEATVIHLARNDVDPDDDVPVMGPETNDNVEAKSWKTKSQGSLLYRVSGELWIDEWVHPAPYSPRVAWDKVPSSCEFIVGPSGQVMNADDLDDEDIGRWLWFRNDIVEAILDCRGSHLEWYTRDTGGIRSGPGSVVHFGVNDLQLITAYAADIAKLPEWHKKLWLGYNVSPEGGVSQELLESQAKAEPADTQAPERYFGIAMERLDAISRREWGQSLFREHKDVNDIVEKIHRFRAKDRDGLLVLSKDVNRVVSDRLNLSLLNQVAPSAKTERRGSLKSLQAALATLAPEETARAAVAPLVGVYELRLGDAHLPSSETEESFQLIPIDQAVHPIQQGFQLIGGVVTSLQNIAALIEENST